MTGSNTPRRWLSVVGIGDDGLNGLGATARQLVDAADVLVGGERHLAMLPEDHRQRLPWPSPFSAMNEHLAGFKNRKVCVLATGDPCCHGVGAVLARSFAPDEMHIVPAPSAFSLACARQGWSLPQVDTLSVHGRPLERLHPFVQPGAKLLLLSENGSTPARVANLLCERGFGDSELSVLCHLGGAAESIIRSTASSWNASREVPKLNTIAIECRCGPDTLILSRVPGLPDECFDHDGQLTKREVRAMTLAALGPAPGQHLWDVGAGCGSVAIEWMRHDSRCRASAVESEPERVDMISTNALALGAPNLNVVHGRAPQALENLATPDAIFIGGGVSNPDLLPFCWSQLAPGGRLVANAVSLEGELALNNWHADNGGQLTRISVERAQAIGRYRGWQPARAVTQLSTRKV